MQNTDSIVPTGKYLARIDEQQCIGCTLCIKACPFDAIVGASRHMHTVITRYCTGCRLCIPPCPVDCITLETNTRFHQIHQTVPSCEQRKLKKEFAAFSRDNRKRRAQRLESMRQERQTLFERRKRELSSNK
ncbi:MAG: RnfABCDGE type electron transport complex subunit B [Gammaproteobacteria bacterium]|nr:RnfABCDGE type electron transport complex subunit B [Gammaproteobacteria bacterium]